jgi:hypothetical protein
MKYDFTMDISIHFSPCTGPLINKINNVNILRNLHLFREYTQQFTVTLTQTLYSRGDKPLAPLTGQRHLPVGLQGAQGIGLTQRGIALKGFSLVEKL